MAEVFVVGDDGPDDPVHALAALAAAAVADFIIERPTQCPTCRSWLAAGDRWGDHRCDGAR
ncbi:hypothetical protein FDO65_10020 [Nakamurella flava]|uniref:Uncharacterized protein n=1 Tax=Nakamurella flava TaxID=2576308 RepID=A0A4U6QMN1_9ACTN|nr:hypothetical protein [Nakamurella flava]TKV61853.1 hypothetical protein FDO65_10020 [Nakamurella flava]